MSDNPLELSPTAVAFRPGFYRHYKGGMYHAFFVARDEDTRESEFVVYQSLLRGYSWIRPLENFLGTVTLNGAPMQRFTYVEKIL